MMIHVHQFARGVPIEEPLAHRARARPRFRTSRKRRSGSGWACGTASALGSTVRRRDGRTRQHTSSAEALCCVLESSEPILDIWRCSDVSRSAVLRCPQALD